MADPFDFSALATKPKADPFDFSGLKPKTDPFDFSSLVPPVPDNQPLSAIARTIRNEQSGKTPQAAPKESIGAGVLRGVQEGFGSEPIGISPENLARLPKWIQPEAADIAKPIDLFTRLMQGAAGGLAGGIGAGAQSPALERDIRAAMQVGPAAEMGAGLTVPKGGVSFVEGAKPRIEPTLADPRAAALGPKAVESELAKPVEQPLPTAPGTVTHPKPNITSIEGAPPKPTPPDALAKALATTKPTDSFAEHMAKIEVALAKAAPAKAVGGTPASLALIKSAAAKKAPAPAGHAPYIENQIKKGENFFADAAKKEPAPSLPMDEPARQKRAQAMGFNPNQTFYHGLRTDSKGNLEKEMAFHPELKLKEPAVFVTDKPEIAKKYAHSQTTLKLWGKIQNPLEINWPDYSSSGAIYNGTDMAKLIKDAKAAGHDVVIIRNIHDLGGVQTQWAFIKPENLRSASAAAFDPKKATSPNLLSAAKTPLSQLLPPATPIKAPSAMEGIKHVGNAIKSILAPSTVDIEGAKAAASIRQEHGVQRRAGEQARAALEQYQSAISKLSIDERFDLIRYIEHRSETPGWVLNDPTLQAVADSVRKGYEDVRKELEDMPTHEKMKFIDDYYSHQWKDPKKAAETFAKNFAPKEGSGSFTKMRTMPTIAEGVSAGLEPLSTDPIETTLRYVENARQFIATNRVFIEAKANGTVRYFGPSKGSGVTSVGSIAKNPPPEGWEPLNGRFQYDASGVRQAYAPAGWAQVYNNFISRGVQGPWGDLIGGAQKASNAITALELGLSGYHVATMANEAIISSVARGIDAAVAGRPVSALKAIVGAPVAPISVYRRGKAFENVYLGHEGTEEFEKIAKLGSEAGMRAIGKGRLSDEYRYSAAGSFWRSWTKGSLQAELTSDLKSIQGPTSAALAVIKNVGRVMETVSAPLFEKYIPRLKNGAFFDTMKSWLEAHPEASHAEQVAEARKTWDSIDNRFGEMVQDNIFWSRSLKQIAQLVTRSYSWDMGTLREIGGGMKDIVSLPKTKEWTRRASYVIALPITYGAMSAAYQYLHTGKAPEDIQDLLAPKTGGDVGGKPERAMLPGYMKDVFGWYFDPRQEALNKVATGPRMVGQMVANQDWKGSPISSPDDDVPTWLKKYLQFVVGNLGPISFKQLAAPQKPGSNLSPIETGLGVRPAPMSLSDPSRYQSLRHDLAEPRVLPSKKKLMEYKARHPN